MKPQFLLFLNFTIVIKENFVIHTSCLTMIVKLKMRNFIPKDLEKYK